MKAPAFWDKHFIYNIGEDLAKYSQISESTTMFNKNKSYAFQQDVLITTKIHAPQIKCSEVDTSEGCAAVQGDR